MSEPTELATFNAEESDVLADIRRLQEGRVALFNSIGTATEEDADATLVAISAAEPITDHLGETINLRHIIVEKGRNEDEKTGEVSVFKRIYLIDEDGTSYWTTSDPVFNELERIVGVRGMPQDWQSAYPIVVNHEGRAPRQWQRLTAVRKTAKK